MKRPNLGFSLPLLLSSVLACGSMSRQQTTYPSVDTSFNPSSYERIAVQMVNTSTERLRGEARGDMQTNLVNRLSSRGYSTSTSWSAPSPAERNVPAWEPSRAPSDSAVKAVARDLHAPSTLVVEILDVRTEPYPGQTVTSSQDSKTGTSTAHGAIRFYDQRTGVSVYARLIDATTGDVLWARRVGGWDVTLNDAVKRLVAQFPAR